MKKAIKGTIILLCLCIPIMAGIILYHAWQGNVKFGFLEINASETTNKKDSVNNKITEHDKPLRNNQIDKNKSKSINESKINNQSNISNTSGDKNHIINGSNNQVGVNGDVNINKEKELSKDDIIRLYDLVNNHQKNGVIKRICISKMPYSNAPLVVSQIDSLFKSKGYEILIGYVGTSSAPKVKGVRLQEEKDGSIGIYVGVFE